MSLHKVILFNMLLAAVDGTKVTSKVAMQNRANPIRKVVTMLQMMQKKTEAEGEKSKELFEKFSCYCKTTEAELSASSSEAEDKIPQLESTIKEGTEMKTQLEGELTAHKSERAAAEEAIAKATAMREKEAKAFAKESAEQKTNLEALSKAIPAIEKGMGGFLQTNTAAVLRQLTMSADLDTVDREALASFLSQGQGHGQEDSDSEYSPGSGEILGILKQLKDEMTKDLDAMVKEEDTAIADFNGLVAAKQKEIAAATKAIEEKTARVGELDVEIVTAKNDLEDTEESLAEDQKLLGELQKTFEIKTKEYEAKMKTMQQELLALADTIKLLNDDDALDLFKKTLPSASAFIQLDLTDADVRQQALGVLRGPRGHRRSLHLDFIALALKGRKVGFEKVITMIDDMVVLLGKEMKDDEKKKEYCEKEFDTTEDKKKVLDKSISDLDKAIAEQQDVLDTLTEEIAVLKKGIADLDTSVAVATQQRKEENSEFTKVLAANNAAKALIEMAKNRMQKFYNPKLYKPPPKRELTEEERITLNMGGTLAPTEPPGGIAGTGITALQQNYGGGAAFVQIKAKDEIEDADTKALEDAVRLPSPPQLYQAKKQDAGGALAMMDLIIADIDKEVTEMTLEEKDSQGDYEETMKSAAEKRSTDAKALTEKEGAKAELEAEQQKSKDSIKAEKTILAQTMAYMADLHDDCDWLLENFKQRAEARANEIDALKKAKDVLSGADYSLVQTGVRRKVFRKPHFHLAA
jgi:chromosome segregation ATPase